jgi:hypothetical protein
MLAKAQTGSRAFCLCLLSTFLHLICALPTDIFFFFFCFFRRWNTWKKNCTKIDPPQTFVSKFLALLFLLRSFVRGSDGYTPQVLEHRSEWDARAGVGVHRRDRECRTRIGGEELSDEKKTKKN